MSVFLLALLALPDTILPVSQPAFPRKQTIELLLHVIRSQSKLAKDASSALIDIGQAVYANATTAEVSALLRGTLAQEVYVRNSCLQALQVREFCYLR